MIPAELIRHVPGCEDGDPPYSQELIGGGRVNRSYLVRTRRGRFVVRLNDTEPDPGIDRDRELVLHAAAAAAGIAPPVLHAAPDHSAIITGFVDGRLWTPHYFSRMRDLRSLGQRLRALHALQPPAKVARFDPLATARRYVDSILRTDPEESGRLQLLLANGSESLSRSGWGSRPDAIVHGDLHHGNVLTADRVYFIDWEYAQVADPMHDLACILAYYPRAVTHGALLLEAAGLDGTGATPEKLAELTQVFTLLNYLWYRARRAARPVPSTDLQLESLSLRRLLLLAPDVQPRHTSAANLRDISGAGNGNGDTAGD